MPQPSATSSHETALERACRSAVGDRLRTVSISQGGTTTTVYRRSDLSQGTDAAVHEATVSDDVVVADGGRVVGEFDHGFVTHVRVGETAVVATTDGLKMDRETELSAVVRALFADT